MNGKIIIASAELAAKIQLSLAMFSGKMDRARVIYEQDRGQTGDSFHHLADQGYLLFAFAVKHLV